MLQAYLVMDYVTTLFIFSRVMVSYIGLLNPNVALLQTKQNPSSQNQWKNNFRGMGPRSEGCSSWNPMPRIQRTRRFLNPCIDFHYMPSCKSHPNPFQGLLANSSSGHKILTEQHFWVPWDVACLFWHGLGDHILHPLTRHGFVNWTLNPNVALLQTEKKH